MLAALELIRDKPPSDVSNLFFLVVERHHLRTKVTLLKNILVGGLKDVEKEAAKNPGIFGKHILEKLPDDFDEWQLNKSQRQTIQNVIQRRFSLIQVSFFVYEIMF